MDLNKAAIFVAVANAGSFTLAAKKLGKPSNSISRNIQELEDELGVRLLHRTTRKLTLTHVGFEFLEKISPAIEAIHDSTRALKIRNEAVTGTVRVSSVAGFFSQFKLEWVQEFLTKNPQANVQFFLSDKLTDLVEDCIDIAFRAGNIGNSNVISKKIFDDHAILVASPAYLEKHGFPESVESLKNHICISPPQLRGLTKWKLEGEEGSVEVEVSGNFSVDNHEELVNAVIKGFGIGLFPSVITNPLLKSGELVRVLKKYKAHGYKGGLVYLNRQNRPKVVIEFMNFMIEKFELQKIGFAKDAVDLSN